MKADFKNVADDSLKHCHELPAGEYAIDMEFDSSRSDDGISMEIFDCNATASPFCTH